MLKIVINRVLSQVLQHAFVGETIMKKKSSAIVTVTAVAILLSGCVLEKSHNFFATNDQSSAQRQVDQSNPHYDPHAHPDKLFEAIQAGLKEVVENLLASGQYDVNYIHPQHKITPLHWAIAKLKDDIAVIFMQQRGINLNIRDFRGYTPLLLSIEGKREHITEALLRFGADPNIPDARGYAPLHFTVSSELRSFTELLVSYPRTNINIQTRIGGQTPLQLAVAKKDHRAVRHLQLAGANQDVKNQTGNSAVDLATLFYDQRMIRILAKKPQLTVPRARPLHREEK